MLCINIRKAINFIYSLIGTKYSWWMNNDDMRVNEEPSYSINTNVPTKSYIKKHSINCVGVINLMRRINNLDIPGSNNPNYKYPGGTYIWYQYLKNKKKLEKFNINKIYPRGTLLLKKYINYYNQGHVAIIYRSSKINTKIIHSYSYESLPNKNLNNPGIIIEPLNDYLHFFTHICLPQDWLI
jgi:hypothetical protein